MVLTVYHDLNVCYYGRPMLNTFKQKTKFIRIKVATILQMLLISIMKKNVPLHPNKCAFLRDQKSLITRPKYVPEI